MSRLKGFVVLVCFAFLSHAASYGVERFYKTAVLEYVSSSENPSKYLFINGKPDEENFYKEESAAAINEAAGVLLLFDRYRLAANVFLQVLLAAIFCLFLFRKRELK